jgi:LCP family protein required for cell wall assembly
VILLLIAAIVAGIFVYKFKDALDVLEMQRVNSVELEDVLRQNMNYQAQNNMILDDYMNIALFGVDSRSGDLLDGDNRSDTIMIASIHKKTGEIRLVSVYRDTVLDVGDGYYTKANTAYALGGPAQAIIMLNRNLDLNILDFVTVGFEGLAHTIDALGGIEIEIDEEERGYLNQYLHDMHLELGTDETPVEKSGKVVVTGIQATAYSRIRYTAGDDFRRAERQRIVLEKTLEKAKNASPTTLVDVANNVIGDMATSLSSREIVNLILMAQKLELKDTGGIPREDARDFTNIEAGSTVMPDTLEDNVVWLHDFLFDNKDYHVSDDVKERNDWIVNNLYPVSYY